MSEACSRSSRRVGRDQRSSGWAPASCLERTPGWFGKQMTSCPSNSRTWATQSCLDGRVCCRWTLKLIFCCFRDLGHEPLVTMSYGLILDNLQRVSLAWMHPLPSLRDPVPVGPYLLGIDNVLLYNEVKHNSYLSIALSVKSNLFEFEIFRVKQSKDGQM